MSSEGAPPESRLFRLTTWFDTESAAVVTILLGLFQVLLSILLAYTDKALPKFYILPLVLGILIVTGGSFTLANHRNPSKLLLQGCACSNAVGLLGATLGFCLYCYSFTVPREEVCLPSPVHDDYLPWKHCPVEILAAYCWSVTLLLLLYDTGAVVLHCFFSVSAFKALKSD